MNVENVPWWAKALGTVVAAAVTSYTTTAASTGDKVSDEKFRRVTVVNCQGINGLRSELRDILREFRTPESADRIAASLERLETVDCSRLDDAPPPTSR